MNLRSCDNCGVVLDDNKLCFPDEKFWISEEGEVNTDMAVWCNGTWRAKSLVLLADMILLKGASMAKPLSPEQQYKLEQFRIAYTKAYNESSGDVWGASDRAYDACQKAGFDPFPFLSNYD